MSFLSGDWWKRDGLRIVRPCRERFDWSGRGVELELLSGGRITSFIVKSPNIECYDFRLKKVKNLFAFCLVSTVLAFLPQF